MDITLINTVDTQGGAARAAYRLHQGLRHIGQNVTMLSRKKASNDVSVYLVEAIAQTEATSFRDAAFSAIQSHVVNAHRSDLSNTLFLLPYPGVDVSQLPAVQKADVINLHWVARFQSPHTIRRLCELGKPVVWTLHDMWALTGGCHYAAGCLKYQADCVGCPQLDADPLNLAAQVLSDKLSQLRGLTNLTFVAPSQWLADAVRQSRLFRDFRVEVIPYSLETDIFKPAPKEVAKAHLGIAPTVTTLLFGAASAEEERKGFSELVQAIWHCLDDPQFSTLVDKGRVEILCFGTPSPILESLGVPVRSLGRVTQDDQLSQIYSAADVFVLPSLEDNLPNTMLEAMSCGTPVVGFDVGGLPDLIQPGATGWLAPLRDSRKLADAILDAVFNPKQRRLMGQNSRALMETQYGLPVQATRYVELFDELLSQSKIVNAVSRSAPVADSMTDTPDAFSHNPADTAPAQTLEESLTAPIDTTCGEGFAKVFDELALRAIATELKQVKADLHRLQAEMRQQQDELKASRKAIAHLKQAESKLQQTEIDLQKAQAERDQTEAQLRLAEIKLQQAQMNLGQREEKLAEFRSKVKELQQSRTRAEAELGTTRNQISAMESSKFWKIRSRWIKVKQTLGLGNE